MMEIWTLLVISILIISGEGCKRCRRHDHFFMRTTSTCIEPKQICDGITYCDNGEDETFCNLTNPPSSCPSSYFQCSSGKCVHKSVFCNNDSDCGDNSDEFYCDEMNDFNCPRFWRKCVDGRRCIPNNWWCDNTPDCIDESDESYCTTTTITAPVTPPVVINYDTLNKRTKIHRNVQWLLKAVRGKRGFELPRAVLALFLASPEIFAPGNRTGSELRDRLKIRILSQISRNATIRSQELALYVQALMVTCEDPRDFFGRNMVSELRAVVDKASFSNPFEILALCNAGGSITAKDVDRVSAAFDSQHRPFWTDVQALATMAMQCLSSKVTVDERTVRDMQDELKKRQFSNGTVENLATTALVVQALSRNGSSVEFFNLTSALDVLLKAQREDGSWGGSIRNSFYLLPALSGRSFLDIDHAHCPKITESEEESLAQLQESGGGGDKWVVQYSVWLGSDVDLGRTWRLRVHSNVSFYDVLETVSKLDSRHNVTYQVVDGKPYVRSLLGKEDDPELGIFWFIYVRPASSKEPPTLLESSPADVQVNPNQELIMWYKPNTWREESAKEA